MSVTLLLWSVCAPVPKPAEPPVTVVTGILSGREQRFEGRIGTAFEGMAILLVGSSHVYLESTEEKWTDLQKGDHVRVRFPRPHPLRAKGEDSEQIYEVAEILVSLDGGFPNGLLVKAGGKYHAFGKFEGAIWLSFQERYLAGH